MNYNKVIFERAFGLSSQLSPCDCPEFVFAGRSNAGKSSLLNKLFNRKALARVSSMPGKTATINFYRLDDVRFVDLPGYGYAKVAKGERRRWDELIGGYFAQDRDIALVFLLVDMRHAPSADDITMVNYLIESEMPFIVLLTKSDKLSSKPRREERLKAFVDELPCGEDITMLPVSSETGEGIEALRGIIADVVADATPEDVGPNDPGRP